MDDEETDGLPPIHAHGLIGDLHTVLRDASFTLDALYRVGYRDEAKAFFHWLGEQGRRHGTPLQIMYGIDGKAELTEEILEHLEGYCGSRSVRLGRSHNPVIFPGSGARGVPRICSGGWRPAS